MEMGNIQYQQEEAIRFLKWIRDNKEKWDGLMYLRTMDNVEPTRAIGQIEMLGQQGFYTAIIMLMRYNVYGIVVEKVISKYTVERAIEKIEARGIKSVFEEFLYIFREEFRKYMAEKEEKSRQEN